MLITPILLDIKTFDATTKQNIYFNAEGGNQIAGNNLIIEKVSTNEVAYNQTQDNHQAFHTISPSALLNGINYRAKIRTKDINNNWSDEYSNSVIFWCYSPPTITITNIDYENQNRVYNQNVIFQASYSQSEGDILQSYRYLLYDSNKDLLETYKEIFPDEDIPLEDISLTQEIMGLENSAAYHVEVITISKSGNEGSSGLILIRPLYLTPVAPLAINIESVPTEGSVKISSNIVQIILKLYDDFGNQISPSNIEFVDDSKIDMNRLDYESLVADDGFYINENNFSLKIWAENLIDNKTLISINSPMGRIDLLKRDNRIIAYKYLNRIESPSIYASNELEEFKNQKVLLIAKENNGAMDLIVDYI